MSILILSTGFGEGHNAAARNIESALRVVSPDTRVRMADVFLDGDGPLQKLAPKLYLGIINHAPFIWEAVYHLMDHSDVVQWQIGIHRAAARRLEALLSEYRPRVVVSTYPGNNYLLDHVFRKRLRRNFRTVTVVTDSLTVNSTWYRPASDVFLLPNEPTAQVLREAGVPEEKIQVPGFPVPLAFATQTIPRQIPGPGEKWRVLYLVNSGRQLAPRIVDNLLACPNIHLSVAVGRDEALGQKLQTIAAGRPLEVYGWIPERLPALMAENHLLVSKAGGATVQEALAARTPMLITQIVPGQEEGNARLITAQGAGRLALSPEAIGAAAQEAFQNNGALWRSWHSATESLSHPNSSRKIARSLLDL